MRIHKEGFSVIIFSGFIFLIFNILIYITITKSLVVHSVVGIIFFLIWLFTVRFFRVPKRKLTFDANGVTAPCDGKVVVIEETIENEFFKSKMLQISIFMSVWNVHQNLSPVSGKVAYYKYHPGLFLLAINPKSSDENERTSIVLETPSKIKIMVKQIAGAVARRIICHADKQEEFAQNEEIGFIKFGSRVDILVPANSKVLVNIGQKTKGGITKIVEFRQQPN